MLLHTNALRTLYVNYIVTHFEQFCKNHYTKYFNFTFNSYSSVISENEQKALGKLHLRLHCSIS